MANIQIFTSPEFGDIRTVDQNGEPWFVGKDVAAALGYAKPENALAAHVDEQDKTTTLIQGDGSNYKSKTTVINESGLYSLIFGSKLEGAVRFKRWVTSEVLPALRKTGSYMMPKLSKEMQALFMLDNRTQRQEERLTALENTMTVDYNQQRVLRKAISRAVIGALGGNSSTAGSSGDYSTAAATGDYCRAKADGKDNIAVANGAHSKARGILGCYLVLTEYDDDGNMLWAKMAKVDGAHIKENVWYTLKNGEFAEAEP